MSLFLAIKCYAAKLSNLHGLKIPLYTYPDYPYLLFVVDISSLNYLQNTLQDN